MKTVVVVQARTGSSRLPGKVLLPLEGRPLLARMIDRVTAASLPQEVVVATTTLADDDPVAELCAVEGIRCVRGHPTDLLDRHLQAGRETGADVVVKIPSDCPLIDPKVIDTLLGRMEEHDGFDYLGNLHPPSWPDGQDVEAIPIDRLETAWREATRPMEREHTTPFFWERPERFRLVNVRWERGIDLSMSHRWTIDYPEDYRFIRAIYERLFPAFGPTFGVDEILALLEREPALATINARYAGVNWYRNHLNELRTVDPSMTRQPLDADTFNHDPSSPT